MSASKAKSRFHYFISFAYADDDPPNGQAKGWVTQFSDELARNFKSKSGLDHGQNGFTYTFSPRDQSPNTVSDYIQEQIAITDVLIVLLSPHVHRGPNDFSKYCFDERELFRAQCQAKGLNAKDRLFVVQIERCSTPTDLEGQRRIPFFEERSGAIRRFGFPTPEISKDQRFFDTLNELAQALNAIQMELTNTIGPMVVRDSEAPVRLFAPARAASVTALDRVVYLDGALEDAKFVQAVASNISKAMLKEAGFTKLTHSGVLAAKTLAGANRPDPDTDFKNNVDDADFVVVLRKDAGAGWARSRFTQARARMARPSVGSDRAREGPERRIILIDASKRPNDDVIADDSAKRWFDLPNATAAQVVKRIKLELGR